MIATEPATWPMDITLHQATGRLDVLWNDGRLARLGGNRLRAACRCAACESARRAGHPQREADTAAVVTQLRPVGDIGLQLVFSDGHDRGIYPWALLRELSEPTR